MTDTDKLAVHDELVAERDRYMGWYYAEVAKRNELVAALQDIARQPEGDEESAQAVARAALAKVRS